MHVRDLVDALERLAPPHLAGGWDNTGLLLGDPADELAGPVLVTIDLTDAVAREAVERGCSAVVAYHPPIFHPLRSLAATNREGRTLTALVRGGVRAVYSPHSALDAAEGGMNDWLLDRCLDAGDGPAAEQQPGSRRALQPAALADPQQTHKLIVFVPRADADAVADAMAAAGAGRIGNYSRCSYRLEGEGTFFAGEGANPAVGERGTLEREPETRLEMVAPARALPAVIAALRDAHPYEEPAFDLYPRDPEPAWQLGPGRIAQLASPTTAGAIARRVRANLGLASVRLAEPAVLGAAHADTNTASNAGFTARHVAVCPGAGASLAKAAAATPNTVFVTGEMSHHDVLAALDAGLAVVLAGHTNTERGYMPILADRIRQALPGSSTLVAERDIWPLTEIR